MFFSFLQIIIKISGCLKGFLLPTIILPWPICTCYLKIDENPKSQYQIRFYAFRYHNILFNRTRNYQWRILFCVWKQRERQSKAFAGYVGSLIDNISTPREARTIKISFTTSLLKRIWNASNLKSFFCQIPVKIQSFGWLRKLNAKTVWRSWSKLTKWIHFVPFIALDGVHQWSSRT